MTPAIAFGQVLREYRKRAGFTQERLGLEAEMARNFISLLELGQKEPTITSVIRLATALGQPAGEMVAMTEARLRAGKR